MMWNGNGYGMTGMNGTAGVLATVLVVGLLVVAGTHLVRAVLRSKDARRVLERRYAAGEIDDEGFRRRMAVLEAGRVPARTPKP